MIQRSIEAAKAVALFFRYKNDVDVYYEDSNDEEFYTELMKRLFRNKKRIRKLISLGSKVNVIEACASDQLDRSRSRLYVVDGDLDLILDSNRKGLKYLHIHDAYCIENLIIEENSVIEVLHDTFQIPREKLEKALTFTNWLKSIAPNLVDLFLHYAIAYKCNVGVPNVSLGVDRLCEKKKLMKVLNGELVQKEIERIKVEILKSISEDEYDQLIYVLRMSWQPSVDILLKIVSGKDYLLPLIHCRMYKIMGKSSNPVSYDSLRIRLLKYGSLRKFSKLKAAILTA